MKCLYSAGRSLRRVVAVSQWGYYPLSDVTYKSSFKSDAFSPQCSAHIQRQGFASFASGDKPEDIYPKAAEELAALGHDSTVSYVAAAAGAVFAETGLLPHVNAGILDLRQLTDLRRCSASQAS